MSALSDSAISAASWWFGVIAIVGTALGLLTGIATFYLRNESARRAADKLGRAEAQIAAALATAENAKTRALQIEEAQKPRSISAEQHARFVAALSEAPRYPIRVVVFSNRQEAIDYGSQIRALLDAAGYRDPAHADAEPIIGPSLRTPNHETVALAYGRREDIDPTMLIQRAFATLGIPMATVLDSVVGLGPGQVMVVVADK